MKWFTFGHVCKYWVPFLSMTIFPLPSTNGVVWVEVKIFKKEPFASDTDFKGIKKRSCIKFLISWNCLLFQSLTSRLTQYNIKVCALVLFFIIPLKLSITFWGFRFKHFDLSPNYPRGNDLLWVAFVSIIIKTTFWDFSSRVYIFLYFY